jgi:hypothetical protein
MMEAIEDPVYLSPARHKGANQSGCHFSHGFEGQFTFGYAGLIGSNYTGQASRINPADRRHGIPCQPHLAGAHRRIRFAGIRIAPKFVQDAVTVQDD